MIEKVKNIMKKEETYEQKKRRLFGRFHRLDDYLGELNHLIKHRVTKQDFLHAKTVTHKLNLLMGEDVNDQHL